MHIVIVLLILAIVIYLFYRSSTSDSSVGHGTRPSEAQRRLPAGFEHNRLVFISHGKLFMKSGDNDPQEVQSPYVQEMMDRVERAKQRHSWKQGTAFESSFVGRGDDRPREQQGLHATTAQFTSDGKLLYFLRDNNVGGLFEYDLQSGTEKRLIHQQRLLIGDLSIDHSGSRILCTREGDNGTASIALMNVEGSDYQEITGGDTVDSAPSWIPSDPDHIVFQSSGVARSDEGYVIALGPASIQMLDLSKRELTPVLEDERTDYLQPKVSPNGDLLFIRRPYEPPRYTGGNILMDFLLFPFRLLRAVFHYLNFFSLMYSRKPLTSASGPKVQADLKELLIKGKRIDAENALKKEQRVNGVRSLVPRSWKLVRRTREGDEQVLASNVASYDIMRDGKIVFSNGYGVFIR
ncbi:MAG: hypothetical protein ABW095_17750 [Candidatus Thiodiazotropha sp.]